ncbi:hypothetical protein DP113_28375 [Brasilonema octagenarum UFV-E1]|uniref:Uncharacterized protein n=2 Tax=Brasilonema TaxID=383614 RepID=A0A856MQJ0_9CYAN|nr:MULTISPECIES: hypothetical protein [Brasilonema]NMF61772.1 hypothetical protein [Brasilonema octagenarum UFV-OR1]QDL11306.1 hypothetical protein DP114_28465 [Brasilonema sennae CENA114]QDL17646.1 hypothetical protein DP113_28375 [Brasilonema octagenarum UFV-E1]
MDIVTLTTFLTPFLPYLLKVGEKAAEETGKELGKGFGANAWEKAKALWTKLLPKIETKPMAKGAAQELASSPDDSDAKETLQKQLKKLLDEDKNLAAEIARLMQEDSEAISKVVNSFNQTISGNDNTVQNTAGDGNKVFGRVGDGATIN